VNRQQQLLELAGKATRATWGGIGLLSQGELAGHLTFGIPDQCAAELTRAPWFLPLIRHIQNDRGPISLEDVTRTNLVPTNSFPLNLGYGLPPLGSFLGFALNSSGPYQGALYLARSPEQAPFDDEAQATALLLRDWLEQWRLLDETHLLTRLRLLSQLAQAAAGSLDLERIVAVALRELDRHIPLQIGAVWLIEGGEETRGGDSSVRETINHPAAPFLPGAAALVLTASSALFGENPFGFDTGSRLDLQETPFAPCLMDSQAVYADLRRPVERNNRLADNLAKGGATAFFAVPLRAGDGTIGVLQSICTRPTGFTNEQIQLLYLVADLLGPAIFNCRLFDRLRAAYDELRRTQTHLIHAEKMRALGELSAGMAHDFNNSLCAVLGFLELTLLDKDLPAHCRRYLESSRTCALDAAQTVHRVQDFARWQKKVIPAELIDPNVLVHQAVELSRHKWDRPALAGEQRSGNPFSGAPQGSADRVSALPCGAPLNISQPIKVEQYTVATARVKGNRAELREVLTNLIFNAVDAMPQGGSLIVRTWNTDRDVYLSVQDTGMGITEAVRRRLFEPFFTTKGERGNGMGLSVSFGIVQRHQGEITVESAPNYGSTFTVRLPATMETAAAEKDEVIEQAPRVAGKSLRVLIVEDEDSIRRFLAAGLVRLGHQARLTSNAEEAMAAFAEQPFDVVLTDLGLPGISGEEVARRITERAPGVPVILLTGWADQIKADKKLVPGVKCILGKPITLSALANTLAAL
jgi:signal transduction histidine kinase